MYKRLKIMYCCLFVFSAYAMEDVNNKNVSPFVRNVLVGSAAGTAEVIVNQPTVFIKNALQQKKNVFRLIKESPKILYKGLGVNAVCMIPTTAAQVSVSNALKQHIPGDEVQTSIMRNAIAGGCSALLCNPSELVVVNQQNWNSNAWATAQRLYVQNGISVALRGYAGKAMRDSVFCAGFLTAYPIVQKRLQQKGLNEMSATVAATALIGPATAVMSHPFDTISTTIQADPAKQNVQGFIDAAKKVYGQGSFKAFFAGFLPRTVRIMIAIPLMNAVKDALNTEK